MVAAKAGLWSNPYLNITREPGVCGSLYPLYIITSDNKVMCSYDLENKNLSNDLEKFTLWIVGRIYIKQILSEDHGTQSQNVPKCRENFEMQ